LPADRRDPDGSAPGARGRFKGWGSLQRGAATTCTVTLSDARSVSATFAGLFTDATAGDTLPANTSIRRRPPSCWTINAVQPDESELAEPGARGGRHRC
jgi:hypothetical protein